MHPEPIANLICSQCNKEFPVFNKGVAARKGNHYCSDDCFTIANRAYQRIWSRAHRDEIIAKKRERYKKERAAIMALRGADYRPPSRKVTDESKLADRRERRRVQQAAYMAAYRESHKDEFAKYREMRKQERQLYNAAYRAVHREERAEYNRAYSETNQDRIKAAKAIYHSTHLIERMAYTRNRRARLSNSTGTHTGDDIRALYERQKHKCAACKVKITNNKNNKNKYEVDHVISLVNGGSNDPGNLQLLCMPCNRKKNAKDDLQWANEHGLLFC